jgi:hypothetical protein
MSVTRTRAKALKIANDFQEKLDIHIHVPDGSKDAPLPRDSGYIDIYSNQFSFAAVKADGSITAWGNPNYGGKGAPD